MKRRLSTVRSGVAEGNRGPEGARAGLHGKADSGRGHLCKDPVVGEDVTCLKQQGGQEG